MHFSQSARLLPKQRVSITTYGNSSRQSWRLSRWSQRITAWRLIRVLLLVAVLYFMFRWFEHHQVYQPSGVPQSDVALRATALRTFTSNRSRSSMAGSFLRPRVRRVDSWRCLSVTGMGATSVTVSICMICFLLPE